MSNREETIPMLMLNHSDSRESDSLPRTNRAEPGSNPVPATSSSSSTSTAVTTSQQAAQQQSKDSGSANCTRHPSTTSNGEISYHTDVRRLSIRMKLLFFFNFSLYLLQNFKGHMTFSAKILEI